MVRARSAGRSEQAVLVATGAVAWTVVAVIVWWARGSINFADRDDGVITLSHARHWVEHGSVAVSAFGDRVAGFSTPLHFVVSLPYFLFGGDSYELWDRVLGFVTIAMVGGLTGLLIADESRDAPRARRRCELAGALVLQMLSWSFFGWHFSGMENPLTTVLLLSVVAIVPWTTRRVRWMALTGTLLGLLAIARLDSITLVIPLAAVVAWGLRGRPRREQGRLLVALAGPPAIIGVITLGAIQLYFGQIRSTTVDNRSRDALTVLALMATAVVAATAVVVVLVSLARVARRAMAPDGTGIPGAWHRQLRSVEAARVLGAVLVLVACAAVAVALADTEVLSSTVTVMYSTGAIWTAALLGLAWCVDRLRPTRLYAFTAVLLWVPCYELVLGPTRLALARVVSSAIPVLSVATVVVLGRLWALRPSVAPAIGVPRWVLGVAVVAITMFGLTLLVDWADRESSETSYVATRNLCCEIEPRSQILLETASGVVGRVDPRITPIIASPDLGKTSYPSQVHIVDLGQIGDPLYLEVTTVDDLAESERLTEYYLMDVYPADVVQVGSSWTCDLRSLIATPRFQQRYARVDVGAASAPGEGDLNEFVDCGAAGRVQSGVYVLRDPSSRADLTLAADLIAGREEVGDDFFETCRDDDATGCFTAMRAFRRAFPGVAGAERAQAALAAAGDGPSARFVRAVINSPNEPGWVGAAFAALREVEAQSRTDQST